MLDKCVILIQYRIRNCYVGKHKKGLHNNVLN